MKDSTTLTIKGQITIPKILRDELGLKAGDKVVFEKEGKIIIIKPAKTLLDFRGYVRAEKYISMEDARRIVKQKRGKKIKEQIKK